MSRLKFLTRKVVCCLQCMSFLLAFLWIGPINAEVVTLPVRANITATASWLPGDASKSPLLILHGFLQTYNFSTVNHLQENLADSDYPVLAPTLSLGIDRRSKMLGCEALHLHNLRQEVEELKQWVDWLYARHHKPVVLIAHSAGGKAVTRYLSLYPDAPIAQTILISFSHLKHLDHQHQPDGKIQSFALGFCKKYLTTEAYYHSYIDWGSTQMIDAIKHARHPVSIILGTADKRILPAWKKSLEEAGINIVYIDGANHFFDSTHEFDLFDTVEALLGKAGE